MKREIQGLAREHDVLSQSQIPSDQRNSLLALQAKQDKQRALDAHILRASASLVSITNDETCAKFMKWHCSLSDSDRQAWTEGRWSGDRNLMQFRGLNIRDPERSRLLLARIGPLSGREI